MALPRSGLAGIACVLAVASADRARAQWIEPERTLMWSADGTRLLYFDWLETAPDDGCFGVRCATPAIGEVRPVCTLPARDWRDAAFAWGADGATAVVASGDGSGDGSGETRTVVQIVPVDGGPERRVEVARTGGPRSVLVRGDTLWLAARDLVQIDLRRSEVAARAPAPAGTRFAVLAAGARVAYVLCGDPREAGHGVATDAEWELGWLEPGTLARQRIARFAGARGAWQVAPWPCFAPDGEGFAVPARDEATEAWEVRVYRSDVPIASFAVLPPEPVRDPRFGQALGNLVWSRDGARLWVASERFDGASHWQLWELRVDGSAPHPRELGHGGAVRCIGSCRVPSIALAPAGDRLAWSTPFARTRVTSLPRRR